MWRQRRGRRRRRGGARERQGTEAAAQLQGAALFGCARVEGAGAARTSEPTLQLACTPTAALRTVSRVSAGLHKLDRLRREWALLPCRHEVAAAKRQGRGPHQHFLLHGDLWLLPSHVETSRGAIEWEYDPQRENEGGKELHCCSGKTAAHDKMGECGAQSSRHWRRRMVKERCKPTHEAE